MAKDSEAYPPDVCLHEMEGKHLEAQQAWAVYHQWEQHDYFNWEKQTLSYLKFSAKSIPASANTLKKYWKAPVQVEQ